MSGELYWLALSAGLALFLWIPYTALYAGLVGFRAGSTDLPPTDKLPVWAKRSNRAHLNLLESLVPFAVLILVLNVSGKADQSTVTAAAIFFWARVAHVIVYTAGIPFARTPAFAIGSFASLYLLWQTLI